MKLLIVEISHETGKKGPYTKLTILTENKTRHTAMCWDKHLQFSPMDFIEADATQRVFNGEVQYAINNAQKIELQDLNNYLPSYSKDQILMAQQIITVDFPRLMHIKFPYEFKKEFWTKPAASKMHEAKVGGLAIHTLRVIQIAHQLAMQHPCNEDVVIIGAALHDIGKIYAYDDCFAYTDKGKMFGHILLGIKMLDSLKDHEYYKDIIHIIASHHGPVSNGWGSIVDPQTIEAHIVFYADYAASQVSVHAKDN